MGTLGQGQQMVDAELSRSGQLFDPTIDATALRLRSGLATNTEVSAEGTMSHRRREVGQRHVDGNRDFYAGHVGIRHNPGAGIISVSAGVGGGYAPGGGRFAAVEAGLALGYENCLRGADHAGLGLASSPVGTAKTDRRERRLRLGGPSRRPPQRTARGGVARGGLRIVLDHDACKHHASQRSSFNLGRRR